MFSVVKEMNLASWLASLQTANKQVIHGVFTGQILMVFIILNKKALYHSCILLILARLPFNFLRP
jgi:hypothetical protein